MHYNLFCIAVFIRLLVLQQVFCLVFKASTGAFKILLERVSPGAAISNGIEFPQKPQTQHADPVPSSLCKHKPTFLETTKTVPAEVTVAKKQSKTKKHKKLSITLNSLELMMHPQLQQLHSLAACGEDRRMRRECEIILRQSSERHRQHMTPDEKGRLHAPNLWLQCMYGSPEAVQLELECNGANPNHKRPGTNETSLHYIFKTPFIESKEEDTIQKIQSLLTHGALIDASDCCRETALGKAVRSNLVKVASILLENGADPNASELEGWVGGGHYTLLQYAIANNMNEMAELLIQHGADMTLAFCKACQDNQLSASYSLLLRCLGDELIAWESIHQLLQSGNKGANDHTVSLDCTACIG